jgi:hypothetical protein
MAQNTARMEHFLATGGRKPPVLMVPSDPRELERLCKAFPMQGGNITVEHDHPSLVQRFVGGLSCGLGIGLGFGAVYALVEAVLIWTP